MTDHAVDTGPGPGGRRRRRYAALLVLPAAGLGAVAGAWFGQSRGAAVEDGLRHVLAGPEAATAVAPPSPGSPPRRDGADELIRRVAELRQELEGLRGLPARLAAEETRRQRLERELAASREDLAAAGDRLAARERERDDARAGLAGARADAAEAGQAAAERDRALAAERAGRGAEGAEAREAAGGRDRALAAERQARATLEDRTAELGAARAGADAERDRTADALAEAEQRLDAARAEVRELAATGSDLDDLGPREPGREAAPQAPSAARDAARTLAAFKDSVSEGGGGGRFEFLGEDRIVVRSSMIFPTGDAEIAGDGRAALDDLAARLRRASERLPPGTPWVLRVDGHADDRTMREESPFASNRHLSAVRASNVVDHLAAAGLPAERMVAAAFGDTRPLAPGTDEATRDRNRRIELRFVTR